MLAAVEANIFATLSHHTSGACAAADDRANRRAFSATGDRTNDRADTGGSADFSSVVLRRITTFDAAFRIDIRLVVAAHRRDFHQIGMKFGSAIVRRTNLIESELELSRALHFT